MRSSKGGERCCGGPCCLSCQLIKATATLKKKKKETC